MLARPETKLGRLLRLPLRLMPSAAIVPILSGPNRGLRWRVGAGIHGCWLGSYERAKLGKFVAALNGRAVVYDIGAHAGYYTLAAARRAGQVIAFEPNPANFAALRLHIERNGLTNVALRNEAVGATEGMARFSTAASDYQGRLGQGDIAVRVTALDRLIEAGLPTPDVVKMDVEGGELDALAGAAKLLADRRAIWFIALHGPACANGAIAILLKAGCRVCGLDGVPIERPRGDIDEIVAYPR